MCRLLHSLQIGIEGQLPLVGMGLTSFLQFFIFFIFFGADVSFAPLQHRSARNRCPHVFISIAMTLLGPVDAPQRLKNCFPHMRWLARQNVALRTLSLRATEPIA